MTYQPPIRSYAGAAPLLDRDPRPHRCGRCNNSTGVLNPQCPNNPNPPVELWEAQLIAEVNAATQLRIPPELASVLRIGLEK